MQTSNTVTNIVPALLKAQRTMGGAKKDSSNPYFKSKYADLGSVLAACKDVLNENGITILQPHATDGQGRHFVETLLFHESGEWLSSATPVVCSKANDPQALGSAITYARRYGLQSFLSMPAEDDDGEAAMERTPKKASYPKKDEAAEVNKDKQVIAAAIASVEDMPKKTNSWRKKLPDVVATATPVMNGSDDY